MRKFHSKICKYARLIGPLCILALAPLGAAMAQSADEPNQSSAPIAHVTIGDAFIDIEPAVGFERATLRISGPGDYALTKSITAAEGGSFLTADLLLEAEEARIHSEQLSAWSSLPDGRYYYEVDFIAGDGSMKREVGTFQVEGGAAFQKTEEESLSQAVQQPGVIARFAGAMLDLLIPSAHAQGGDHDNFVSIRNTTPGSSQSRLNLNATDSVSINDDAWRIMNDASEGHRFKVVEGSGSSNVRFSILQGGNVGVGTSAPQDQLHVYDPNGFQMRLTDDDITTRFDNFIDRFAIYGANPRQFQLNNAAPTNSMVVGANGAVGLGTDSPGDRLHVVGDGLSQVLMENTTAGTDTSIGTDEDGRFRVRVPDNFTKMVINSDGDVGIGSIFNSSEPDAALHVRRSGDTANVRVEDTGAGSPQVMFQLLNNGFPQFNMQDTSQADMSWSFRLSGNAGSTERFTITKVGTGGAEFELFHDGSANFAGDVTASGVSLTSTREAKTDFRALDEQEILDKLSSLEISQWRYKHEDEGTTHVGPVAEEFHEVFGLSDGKTLNMIDTNGITFAAIQALNAENRELKERLAALESKIQ